MAEFSAEIEAYEHQWMRAWINKDLRQLRKSTHRDFRFLLGSSRTVLLDRTSLIEGAERNFSCAGYKLGDGYVRRHGTLALYATQAELDMQIGGKPWFGQFWMVDIWTRRRVKGRWRLTERCLSRPETEQTIAESMKALQLWR